MLTTEPTQIPLYTIFAFLLLIMSLSRTSCKRLLKAYYIKVEICLSLKTHFNSDHLPVFYFFYVNNIEHKHQLINNRLFSP